MGDQLALGVIHEIIDEAPEEWGLRKAVAPYLEELDKRDDAACRLRIEALMTMAGTSHEPSVILAALNAYSEGGNLISATYVGPSYDALVARYRALGGHYE